MPPAAGAPAVVECLVRTPLAASNSPVCSREPQAVAVNAAARSPTMRRARVPEGRQVKPPSVFIPSASWCESSGRFAPFVRR